MTRTHKILLFRPKALAGSTFLCGVILVVAATQGVCEPPGNPCDFRDCYSKHIGYKECHHNPTYEEGCFQCLEGTDCYIWDFYVDSCDAQGSEMGCLTHDLGWFRGHGKRYDNGDCDPYTDCDATEVHQWVSEEDCDGRNCEYRNHQFFCPPDLGICGPPAPDIAMVYGPVMDYFVCDQIACE